MFNNLLEEIKNLKNRKNEGLKGFTFRFLIYIFLLSLVSTFYPYYKVAIGQPFYSTNGGFYKYLFFFILIIFVISQKEKIEKSYAYKNKLSQTIGFLILSIVLYSTPFTILSDNLNITPIVANYLIFSIASISLALSIFNINFIFKYMQEESLKLLLLIMAFFSAPLIFKNLWTIIFTPIKWGINFITNLTIGKTIITEMQEETGLLVNLKDFNVGVGPACSGIQSIIAFTILYLATLIFLKKEKRINKKNAISIFLLGIISLYILNIARIIVLIYTGAYISEELAINLFHEYLSSLIFLFIFMIFIKKFSKKLFI
ncbi:MAG: exosortase/archaeosortase family protein [Candidatus Gracilibacteria bacterium]|jgi:exosortase/archaeosortase family protein|nr:exosortase/archaeosortase family protein [Candidatus Gracilibacteria bacterium]